MTSRMSKSAGLHPPGQCPPGRLCLATGLNGSAVGSCPVAQAAWLPAWAQQHCPGPTLEAFPTTPAPPSPSPDGRDTGARERGKQCLYIQVHTHVHTYTHTHTYTCRQTAEISPGGRMRNWYHQLYPGRGTGQLKARDKPRVVR